LGAGDVDPQLHVPAANRTHARDASPLDSNARRRIAATARLEALEIA
jgi:hypothetical protein